MKIYGDKNSGNCLKVKWVCDHLAIAYTWIDVDTSKGGSRTVEFLQLNPFGQVPAVVFDDGRALAQSNAIIRYLARGSALIPADAFAAAQMEAWMYWEQNSHEPYVAVARFQMVYLGRAASELDPNLVKRGYGALDQLEQRLGVARFLLGGPFRSPMSRCWPIHASRMKAGSIWRLTRRCGVGSPTANTNLVCRRRCRRDRHHHDSDPNDHHPPRLHRRRRRDR